MKSNLLVVLVILVLGGCGVGLFGEDPQSNSRMDMGNPSYCLMKVMPVIANLQETYKYSSSCSLTDSRVKMIEEEIVCHRDVDDHNFPQQPIDVTYRRYIYPREGVIIVWKGDLLNYISSGDSCRNTYFSETKIPDVEDLRPKDKWCNTMTWIRCI